MEAHHVTTDSSQDATHSSGVTAGAAAVAAMPATAASADGDRSGLLITNFMASWASQDPDLVASCFTEDAVWYNSALPPALVGRAAIREFFANGFAATTFLTAEITQQIAKGSRVMHERVDRYHFIGSDHDVNLQIMGSFLISGVKIAVWNDYWDLAQSEFPTA